MKKICNSAHTKSGKVKGFSNLHPISETCVLARCFEKLLVNKFYKPVIYSFKDQHAYKKSDLVTTACLTFLQKLPMLLKGCDYVRCLLIDFSKAFDVVRPELLKEKQHSNNYLSRFKIGLMTSYLDVLTELNWVMK